MASLDEVEALIARRQPLAVGIAAAGLALAVFALARIGVRLADGATGFAPLWLANGIVVALLLRLPALPRVAFVATAFGALLLGIATSDTPILAAFGFALVNTAEIIVALLLMRRLVPRSASVETPRYLAYFVLVASVIAPVVGALGGGAIVAALYGSDFATVTFHWFTADALGMIVAGTFILVACTPDCLALLRDPRRGELLLHVGATAALSVVVFGQSRYPTMFTLLPLLTVAAFRFRFVGAVVTIGIVAMISTHATMVDTGPIASRLADPGERILFLQLFIAVAIVSTLPVAATLVERERLVRTLREQRRAYRLLAEHSNDMIVRMGLDGIRRYVSPASRSMLGYSPDELMGKSPFPAVHPEDRAGVEAMFASLIDSEEQPTFTYRMRHRDGSYVWLEATYRLVRDEQGAPAEFVTSVRNVTRRREAELSSARSMEQLQESLRLLGMAERMGRVGHWRLDVAAQTLFWSDEVFRIHGRSPGDTPSLQGGIDSYHPEDRAMVTAHVERTLDDGTPWSFRARLIRPDGEIRQVESSGEPERARDGRIVGVVGVFRDVTDEAAAEALLIAARDDAHALAEAKSAFLATMSHEIRTPMTGVLGMIELLRADPDAATRDQYLDNLEQSAGLLMALLDDVLDFSKIEGGAMPLERIDFDLGAVVRSTLDLFHHAASSKGLQLSLSVPVGRDLRVAGDPVRLRQILANLVSNAIKFTQAGRVDVSFDLIRAGEARIVRGRVADTGIGIDAATIGHLFEPFRQADASTTRRFGGTGLGLAISRRLVEAMDGEIGVQSEPGRGTVFSFEVRLSAASEPAAHAPPAPAAPVRALSILLAEDNAINRALVAALVRRGGHRLVAVEDGREAVGRAAAERFDAILMDMQMPEMDGLQATRAIRDGGGPNAATPIIALTADAAPDRRALYDDVGLSAFLTKPIDSAALAAALQGVAEAPEPVSAGEAILNESKLAGLSRTIGAANLSRFLDMLADEVATRPLVIARLVAEGKADDAAREAHSMKGAALNIGADRLAELARRIETAATAGDPLDPLVPALMAVAAATGEAIAARSFTESVAAPF